MQHIAAVEVGQAGGDVPQAHQHLGLGRVGRRAGGSEGKRKGERKGKRKEWAKGAGSVKERPMATFPQVYQHLGLRRARGRVKRKGKRNCKRRGRGMRLGR